MTAGKLLVLALLVAFFAGAMWMALAMARRERSKRLRAERLLEIQRTPHRARPFNVPAAKGFQRGDRS